jgi:hypothetical protein
MIALTPKRHRKRTVAELCVWDTFERLGDIFIVVSINQEEGTVSSRRLPGGTMFTQPMDSEYVRMVDLDIAWDYA